MLWTRICYRTYSSDRTIEPTLKASSFYRVRDWPTRGTTVFSYTMKGPYTLVINCIIKETIGGKGRGYNIKIN